MIIALWIILALLVLGFLFFFLPFYIIADRQMKLLFTRTSPDKWNRTVNFPDDPEYVAMMRGGEAWAQEHKDVMTDVSITNDGLKLCGQYYDFGHDKAVILIPGRTEGCTYSCYFAEPYRKAGYNVLAIDNRSHGHSEGKYNNLGLKEYRDILAWGRMLNERYGIRSIVCHGVCIGSATALYAFTTEGCPDYFTALVADGMFTTFRESFKEHMVQDKRPIFPFINIFFMIYRLRTGVDPGANGPVFCIDRMTRPILFLHSREDVFSLPGKTQGLYDKCPSEHKKIVFFDKGRHSFVRINNTEKYDQTVTDFLSTL